MTEKKTTIKDIARLAEVSPGTVDRVLHNRGKVSADKKARIDKVLEEINYQPNLIAKTLKNNRIHRIGVLMPYSNGDQYWERAERGLEKGLDEFGTFGIATEIHRFRPDKIESFSAAAAELLATQPDGLLVVPMFPAAVSHLFEEATERQIPIITFNTRVDDDNSSFIGQDLIQSGRVAGNLVVLSQRRQGPILVLHIDEAPDNAPHIADKERGFIEYLRTEGHSEDDITTMVLHHRQETTIADLLRESSVINECLRAAFITTSRSYEVAAVIKEQAPDAVIVGYDLVEGNARLLKEGTITYLIDQNPYQQAYLGISVFSDHFVFGKALPPEQLLPLNVVFQENIDSVLNGRAGVI